MHHSSKGFTLIELSIVIVIIGFIVAAIIGGQQIIESTKLKALTQDAETIRSMVNIFKLEYGQYPGDIDHAHNYWGSDCDPTPSECNGNNDGTIDQGGWGAGAHETHRIWQHLYLADLTPVAYTGYPSSSHATYAHFTANANEVYYSQDGNYKFMFFTYNIAYGWPNDKHESYNGQLWLSHPDGNVLAPPFTIKEAYYIDTLIDDGKADTGIFNGVGAGCSAHPNANGADYRPLDSRDDLICVGRFNLFP